jgi:hypothetical protein
MGKKYEYPHRAAEEARILEATARWEHELEMGWLSIGHIFVDQVRGEESDDIESTAAVTYASWEYRHATITWYLPAVGTMTDEALNDVVVHELVHVLLAPLRDHLKPGSIKQEEFATECVARAIVAARKAPRV